MPEIGSNNNSHARLPPDRISQIFHGPRPDHHRQEATLPPNGSLSAPRPGIYPGNIRGKGKLPSVIDNKNKNSYSPTNSVSASKLSLPPPHQVNQTASLRSFNENVSKATGKGHAQDVKKSSYEGRFISEQWSTWFTRSSSTDANGVFAPESARVSAVRRSISPPPDIPLVRVRPDQGDAVLIGIHDDYPEHRSLDSRDDRVRASAAKEASYDSFGASDSTSDINFTISKDSSADEGVRQAKLLAEMGERSQRNRSGNGTAVQFDGPQSDDPPEFFRLK